MPSISLVRLHRYNGWNLVVLLVTGVLLFAPGLRGPIAPVRTLLKQLHILSGILSVVLLAAYLPLSAGHWRRLGRRIGQRINVVLMAVLLIGWAGTGIALWFNRDMPAGWSETALLWHDRLTWFAIPWAATHSITRYFKLRLLPVTTEVPGRRLFLTGTATVIGAIVWGRFGRLLKLPGFESEEPVKPTTLTHEPIPDDTFFVPPPVSPAPAGGGRKGRFRVYTVTDRLPNLTPKTWRLALSGLVERPQTLTWEDFLSLPRTVQVSNFHCVTGWSVYNVTWEGIRLSDLLDRVGVKAKASHVKFYSGDGVYTDAVPLDVARMDDVMLPYLMDGGAIPAPLGGPVRLIIPQMYAYKSVKWLTGIELIDRPHEGYWEVRGYPDDAWLRKG